MADRRGAWASLLSLFRLVYDGGGADPNYLPARHGELFDPDAYPFLEGRDAGSHYDDGILDNLPAISDDVVEKVLSRLLWLADDKVAQRLSYRSLDVEQIGSVYEGIMGFTRGAGQRPQRGDHLPAAAPEDHDHRGGGCRAAAGPDPPASARSGSTIRPG